MPDIYNLRSGLFLLCFSLLVLWESLRAGLGNAREPGSGFLAFCVGLVLAGLALVLIKRGFGVKEQKLRHPRTVVLALVSLFGYSLLLTRLGFIIATFLFVLILFRLPQKRPWWVIAGMSALITGFTYLLFGIALQVHFPQGILRFLGL
jgi:putative tricarboxylic transport membrane protein